MIDCEAEIFSAVASAVRGGFSGIFVSGEAIPIPPRFPAVTIVEEDNSTFQRTLDTSGTENHARLMYTINVYSNKTSGAKQECRKIIGAIDSVLYGLGFMRTGSMPSEVPNADASIYRMVSRYRATISKDKIIYRS